MITHLQDPNTAQAPKALQRALCPAPPRVLTDDPNKATCISCLRLCAVKLNATRKGLDGLLYRMEQAWACADDLSTIVIDRELRHLL